MSSATRPTRIGRASQYPTTSLDTQRTSDTQSHSDPPWVYAVRDSIAEHLDSSWPIRAKAMRDCGRAGIAFRCKKCGALHVFPRRCGARTCPTCARKGAAALAHRASKRVASHDLAMELQSWDGPGSEQLKAWKFLTLTRRAREKISERFEHRALRKQVRSTREHWRDFWLATPWGRQKRDPGNRNKRIRKDTSYLFAEG